MKKKIAMVALAAGIAMSSAAHADEFDWVKTKKKPVPLEQAKAECEHEAILHAMPESRSGFGELSRLQREVDLRISCMKQKGWSNPDLEAYWEKKKAE